MTFSVSPGKHVAIVGESGAGKSTILQLLLKLRPYQAGSVRLNEKEIKELPEDTVRHLFAVVTQHVQLFNATVMENLRLAEPNASREECMQAARNAFIHDRIEALPQGYDTVLGEWGARLSGGERQRLALARALLRNSPVFLFDEPTTGLDPLTAQAFVQAMRSILKNKTVIWITHKLDGLEVMDDILFIRDGTVCEQGTHSLLIRQKSGSTRK
ncbi:ABC transporter [Paenibacillus sp. yr247]|uniref:ATP-binding cassette domain-containing protein n=1 Tax=Paenibacillus sp. yr247 TaxID=1761880 RepID=UPI00088E08E5|nr:ATP-binding cassette domain-containing protein [Paenibacillus sp. yr247]SDP08050.1 ABC transporter [Paenibacillus sp. yr247]